MTTYIYTDSERLKVDVENIHDLKAAMEFKARNIKAKAEPILFEKVAEVLGVVANG